MTQAGIAGASWSIAGSFSRGLLPRNPIQQAVATGATAAIHYELTATAWAALQAIAAKPGQRPGIKANVTIAVIGVVGGLGANALATKVSSGSLVASGIATAGRITSFAALAGGAAASWDALLHQRHNREPRLGTTLVPAVITGGAVVGVSLIQRNRRAHRYGIVSPDRRTIAGVSPRAILKASGIALGTAVGLSAATAGEQIMAHQLERGMRLLIRREPGALGSLLAHGIILSSLTVIGVIALAKVTSRIQRQDDIVEPAYPAPPSSQFVSCGPMSVMPFDSIGKEGRRFVLMALTAGDIENIMGENATNPIRVVGGFESASTIEGRVDLMIDDLRRLGAFERSILCVGSPTGVGYFNYSVAEALEYLTLGDCAIVVPQYALVPSALALGQTKKAEELTRLLLERIREISAHLPNPPKIILIGESLGANIALDIACNATGKPHVPVFDQLGVSGGLYLGVPFRTKMWKAWRAERMLIDPHYQLELVSQPSEISRKSAEKKRHLMIVHHDDPVNKYNFQMILQPPWWMGAPVERPPLVPRESKFRPFTSFILATIDLLNGMQSKPGTFIRRGHDYRIDIREGLEKAFGLSCTPEQAQRVEIALRERETQWATKRMVARKLDKARRSIEKQLEALGHTDTITIADLDPRQETSGDLDSWKKLTQLTAPPGT